MAIAKFELVCCECGKVFEVRQEKRNRAEADAYEAWARQSGLSCPACRSKARLDKQDRRALEAAAMLEAHGITLPEITAVSDRQRDWALSVRARILASSMDRLESYVDFRASVDEAIRDEAFAATCYAHGMTVEDAIADNLRCLGLEELHLALTATSAREILDNAR